MGQNTSNEQLFEFMTKMYSDLSGKIDNMDNKIQGIEENMSTKQDIVRLENKMDVNDKVLHDGYKQTYEKLNTLENKIDEIDKKVEKQDVEIRVIKTAK